MPWNAGVFTRTDGIYNGSTVWQTEKANGVLIVSNRHDTHDQDIANGINACLLKDGSNTATAITTAALTVNGSAIAKTYGSNLIDKGTITTAVTIDWTQGNYQSFTETSLQNPTVTFIAPAKPCSLWLKIVAPTSGTSPTIFWPATISDSSISIEQTLSINSTATLEFYFDGTKYNYRGGEFSDLTFNGPNGGITLAALAVLGSTSAGQINAKSYGSTFQNQGTITTAVTIDWRTGQTQKFTETSLQNPTVTFTAPANAAALFLEIAAPASGTSPTITWPASVKGAPPVSITLAKTRVLQFQYDGTNYIFMNASAEY